MTFQVHRCSSLDRVCSRLPLTLCVLSVWRISWWTDSSFAITGCCSQSPLHLVFRNSPFSLAPLCLTNHCELRGTKYLITYAQSPASQLCINHLIKMFINHGSRWMSDRAVRTKYLPIIMKRFEFHKQSIACLVRFN